MDIDDKTFNYDDFSPFISSDCHSLKDDLDEIFKTEPFTPSAFETFNQNSSIYDHVSNIFEGKSVEIKSEQESSSNENNSYIDIDFDPDEFLNYVKSNDVKSEITDRSTPSPTHSSESDSSGDNRSSNESISSFSNSSYCIQANSGTLDTPPISPQNIISCIGPPSTYYNNNVQHDQLTSFVQSSESINQNTFTSYAVSSPAFGTQIIKNCNQKPLITTPVTNKLQSCQVSAIKSKTIVLSTNDYKNLVENCKVKNTGFPKIILKNVNGQMINGSSIKPILPKIEESNQQKTDVLPVNRNTSSIPPIMGIIDEKTLKKHERLIKNRKSASISRLKKKDYISSLELKVNDLEKENSELKGTNAMLQTQLENFSKNCQCSKAFVNMEQNKKRKLNDTIILSKHITSNSSFSLNKIIQNANLRKNTAVLLAMVLMVSLNFGFNFITPQSNDILQIKSTVHHSRGLLWVNEADNFTKNSRNHTNSPSYSNYKFEKFKNNTQDLRCPVYINQTENLRLASELRKWISVSNYQNLTSTVGPFKHVNDYIESDLKNILTDINEFESYLKRNKQNLFHPSLFRKKLERKLKQKQKQKSNVSIKENSIDIYQPPKSKDKYSKLFDQINRRDDTFYLVSFNKDHILLPASAYNKSSRPKMSLMLPTSDPFGRNGKFTLMQIDCEVLNATMIQLDENLVPRNLRPKYNDNKERNKSSGVPIIKDKRRFSNISTNSNFNKFQNYSETKEKLTFNEGNQKLYKPYFLKKLNSNFENQTIENNIKKHGNKLPFVP